MRWDELDQEKGTLTISATRSKNGRAHTLPLPPMAWQIIASVPVWHGGDYLFGRRSGFGAWAINKTLLDHRAGIVAWTVHDIRRSVATGMAEIGIAPHVIEAVLNHVSGHKGGIAGIYNKATYEREMRSALALWADHVRSLVEGGPPKVVMLGAAKP